LASARLLKVTVYVHIVFLKVGEIDTVKETYTADVFVQARWREPLFDGKTHLVRTPSSCIESSVLEHFNITRKRH